MLKSPLDWTEKDLMELISDNRPESLTLEYKRSEALTEPKKDLGEEISKDVAAMANSAGGIIIYGLDEQKSTNGPLRIDGGIDPKSFSAERLGQVIDSSIQRRIEGLDIHQMNLSSRSSGKVIYVVSVPQSKRAPHMSKGNRYYKRYETRCVPMEEYEVRDVARRNEGPDLDFDFEEALIIPANVGEDTRRSRPEVEEFIAFRPNIINRNPEPAFYSVVRLHILDLFFEPVSESLSPMQKEGTTKLIWERGGQATDNVFTTFRQPLMHPQIPPLLEGERLRLGGLALAVPKGSSIPIKIACEIRSPKMPTVLYGIVLYVAHGHHIDLERRIVTRPVSPGLQD